MMCLVILVLLFWLNVPGWLYILFLGCLLVDLVGEYVEHKRVYSK